MPEAGEPLSEREREVLTALAKGATNQEIAQALSISPNTVKVHLRRIYAKLDASTRTEAVRAGVARGLPLLGDAIPMEEAAPPLVAEEPPGRRPSGSASWRWATLIIAGLVVLLLAALVWQGRPGALPAAAPAAPLQPTAQLGESDWFSDQPLPAPVAGMAVAAVGLDLVQIGGETAAGIVNSVYQYDTDGGRWRDLAAKPTAVTGGSAAVLGGEIYVVGGRLADGQPTAVVEAYSPSNNAWRQAAPLPEPLWGTLALSDGSQLYAFGGQGADGAVAAAYLYDPGSDAWRGLPPMPAPRSGSAGGVIRGILYVVGGQRGESALADCVAFDPAAASWARCPDMLSAHADAGAAVLVNRLYVLAGATGEDATTAEVFDPAVDRWQPVEAPMLAGVPGWTGAGVVVVESDIYLLGGRRGEGLSDAMYRFAPLENKIYLPAAPGGSP